MARMASKKKQPMLKPHSSTGKISYKARSSSHNLGSFFGKNANVEEEEEEAS